MSIVQQKTAFVSKTSVSINISQMFTVAAGGGNPAYLVLTALDRNEYTAAASGAVGSFTGNGATDALNGIGDDGRGAGLVFVYQPSTGRYYNSTYGYLDQLSYVSSSSAGDVTNLSLFAANSANQAATDATDAYAMMQTDPSGYLGSSTIVTQSGFAGTVPAQATPDSIAAIADSFVGQAWNMNGCWVLASTIAADAGASLPVQSTAIGQPGQSNGEWIVAFNGPAGQSGNWQSIVTAGEIVVIGTPGGGGHITTCVSGTGSTARLVDNITYENGSGTIQNPANDGSASDVTIASPHLASQEWAGVNASSVVIYELDTPIVTATIASDTLALRAAQSLGTVFSAADPGGRTITQWQVYNAAAGDALVLNGVSYQDHSTATALTATSLSSVSLLAGAAATTDMLDVRAYNGSFWGDWTTLAVAVSGSAPVSPPPAPLVSPPPAPPVLTTQTAAQTWLGGNMVNLTLPAATFTDPQGQGLTYRAMLSNGQALPVWLKFNPATETFSGLAPSVPQTLSIVVQATDTSLLSAADTFNVTVLGDPVLTTATPNQTWTEGSAVSLTLPANAFTDPQGQSLTYTATQSNGQALPSWLSFDPATGTFSGTAPATPQALGITVTATDSSGLSATESFSARVVAPPPPPAPPPGITVSAQTANQTWIDGQAVDFVLPGNTFTDALGLRMRVQAFETAGPRVTSWLYFRPATMEFYGTVPANTSGTMQLEVLATDAWHMQAEDLFTVTFAAAPGRSVHFAQTQTFAEVASLDTMPKTAVLPLHA